jgi:hypothetical protein
MKPHEFTIPQQFMVGDIKINTRAQLDRTYLRPLINAFIPYQEAMLVYLDELHGKACASTCRGPTERSRKTRAEETQGMGANASPVSASR